VWNSLEELDLSKNKNLIKLECSSNKLTSLKLVSCKYLYCDGNNLDSIDLKGLKGLEALWCDSNEMTSINFLTSLPCPEKLLNLSISKNKFPIGTLYFLKKFKELRTLDISENEFYGSLEFLKSLSKLKMLDIGDTNIDKGLKELPKDLETIRFSSKKKKNTKSLEIKKQLDDYDCCNDGFYDFQE
jgi:Leucine-rich repeat (LRR) protein